MRIEAFFSRALIIFVLAGLSSCATLQDNSPAIFSVSYAIQSDFDDYDLLHFYDESLRVSIQGRRDVESTYIGEPDIISYCKHAEYCALTRLSEIPIIINRVQNTFNYTNYRYTKEKIDRTVENCDSYIVFEAERRVADYQICSGLGLVWAVFYHQGGELETMTLRSFTGLGAILKRPHQP
jgi:hypothetical protein